MKANLFFFFFNFYFILLYNYCIGFAIHQHESAMVVYTCSQSWTPIPLPSPYHPSGSSQCTSPKHPVSCIEPGLGHSLFLYDIIHVSMLFSQIIPPSLSPTESKRLFYTSVSYHLSHLGRPRGWKVLCERHFKLQQLGGRDFCAGWEIYIGFYKILQIFWLSVSLYLSLFLQFS